MAMSPGASEPTPLAASEPHPSPVAAAAMDPDPFLEGLERKAELFKTLWSSVAELQHASGDSVHAWKAKSREVEELRAEVAELGRHLQDARMREVELANRFSSLESSYTASSSELGRVQQELRSHQTAAAAALGKVEEARRRATEDNSNLRAQLDEARLDLERRAGTIEQLERVAAEDAERSRALRRELAQSNDGAEAEHKRLREAVAKLENQLEDATRAKDEMGRHLWNVTDEVKTTKAALESSEASRHEFEAKFKEAAAAHRDDVRRAAEAEEALHARLAEVRRTGENLQVALDARERELEALRSDADQAEQTLSSDLAAERAAREAIEEARDTFASELEQVRSEFSDHRRASEATAEGLRGAAKAVQETHLAEVLRLEKELDTLQGVVAALEADQGAAASATAEAASREAALREELDASRREFGEVASEVKSSMSAKAALERRLQTETVARQDAEAVLAQTRAKLQAELADALARLEQADALAASRQADRDALEAELGAKCDAAAAALQSADVATQQRDVELTAAREELQQHKRTSEVNETKLREQLLEAQGLVTSAAEKHSGEAARLRSEVEKFRNRAEALEAEKRDLIVDCSKLNEEGKTSTEALRSMQDKLSHAEETNVVLLEDLEKSKRARVLVEEELQSRTEVLRKEIEDHLAGRKESLLQIEDIRTELKMAKKEAAQQVSIFSDQMSTLNREIGEARDAKVEADAALARKKKESAERLAALNEVSAKLDTVNERHAQEIAAVAAEAEAAEERARAAKVAYDALLAKLTASREECDSLAAVEKELRQTLKERDKGLSVAERVGQSTQARLEEEIEATRLLRLEIARRKEDYQALSSDLATLRSDKAGNDRESRVVQAKLEKELAQLREDLQNRNAEISAGKTSLVETQQKLAAVQEAANKTINNLMAELKKTSADWQDETATLRKEIKEQHNLYLDLQNDRESHIKRATAEKATLEREVDRLGNLNAALQGTRDELQREISRQTDEAEGLSRDIEGLNAVVGGLERRLATTEDAKAALETELGRERKERVVFKREFTETDAKLRLEIKAREDAQAATQSELASLKREKDWTDNESQIRVSALNRQLNSMQQDLQRKGDELAAADRKLSDANAEISELQEAANRTISALRGDMRTAIESGQREVEDLKKQTTSAENRSKVLEQERTVATQRVHELEAELEEVREYSNNRRDAAAELSRRAGLLDKAKRKLEMEVRQLRGGQDQSNVALNGQREEHARELSDLHAKLAAFEAKNAELERANERVREREQRSLAEAVAARQDHSTRASHDRIRELEATANSFFQQAASVSLVAPSPIGFGGQEASTIRDLAGPTEEEISSKDAHSDASQGLHSEDHGATIQSTADFLRARRARGGGPIADAGSDVSHTSEEDTVAAAAHFELRGGMELPSGITYEDAGELSESLPPAVSAGSQAGMRRARSTAELAAATGGSVKLPSAKSVGKRKVSNAKRANKGRKGTDRLPSVNR